MSFIANGNKTKEHYVEQAYGYPFFYTPVNEMCDKSSRMMVRSVPRKRLNEWNNKECIENFQMVQQATCVPVATLVLYTSVHCTHCEIIMPEWNKYVNHVRKICKYNKMIRIVHLTHNHGERFVPMIKLFIHDKNSKKNGKVFVFNYERTAEMIHRFVIENLSNEGALDDDSSFFTECKTRGSPCNPDHSYHPLCE